MPEGPEVRRAADRLEARLLGRVIEEVGFGHGRLASAGARLSGATLTDVHTHGKVTLLRLQGAGRDRTVLVHLGMDGGWRWGPARGERAEVSRTNKERLRLRAGDQVARCLGCKTVEVFRTGERATHPVLTSLGPDTLVEPAPVLAARYAREDERPLGHLLLDQRVVAGVGNYLRAEILFELGLRPEQARRDVDADILAAKVVEVLQRAYTQRGVTLPEPQLARLRFVRAPERDRRHHVYGRRGRPCFRCGALIERVMFPSELGGPRPLDYCPSCQPGESR